VPSIPLVLGVGVAILAVAAWFGLLAVLMLATRTPSIRPGLATGELGPESPALVDLLTGGWTLCDEAASAALLDLAARRVVTIEEVGPELSLVRLGRGPVPRWLPTSSSCWTTSCGSPPRTGSSRPARWRRARATSAAGGSPSPRP
jgi:hypothetical protein